MSSNVGLSTPRGSGTSGYVQRNLSLLKPRSTGAGTPYPSGPEHKPPRPRKPDQDILRHDRLREIEIQVLELRDRLEDEGEVEEDEIEERCGALRDRLVGEMDSRKGDGGKGKGSKGIKGYQVHELAEAKAVESERLRRALGLKGLDRGRKQEGSGEDVQEDEEHPMARQERRRKEKEMERVRMELEIEEHGRG